MKEEFFKYLNQMLNLKRSNYNLLLNSDKNIDFVKLINQFLEQNNWQNLEKLHYNAVKEKVIAENLRHIIDYSQKTSFNDNYKIIILENCEKIDKITLNILLKIIEEPISKVIFFITSNNIYAVPKSLKSRCFLVRLNEQSQNNQNIKVNFIDIFSDVILKSDYFSDDNWQQIKEGIIEFFINLLENILNIKIANKKYQNLFNKLNKNQNLEQIFDILENDKKKII